VLIRTLGDVPGRRLLVTTSGNSGLVFSALTARTCNGVKRLPSRRWAHRTPHRQGQSFEDEDEHAKRQTPNAERQTPNAERRTPNAERRTPNG
jgi:hypothetical protein